MMPASAIAKTCVSNMTLWPRIAFFDASGGALDQTKNVIGAKPPRIVAAIAKLITIRSENMREQHDAVAENRVFRCQRRRVRPNEECNRRETSEDCRGNRKTHHDRKRGLFE